MGEDRGMKPTRKIVWGARWLARGVPGVYRAARSAGLGRRESLRVLEASASVLALAKKRYPRRWRAENAVRHFVWQAWLAATYGPDVAAAIGRAHERSATDRDDTAVDRENNRIGREYGVAHAERIRADAMRPAQSALADEAGRLWNAGQLTASTGSGGGT
jgi:hypothetical protein